MLLTALALALGAEAAAAADADATADAAAGGSGAAPTLLRVVAVGRHGVKNPQQPLFAGAPIASYLREGAALPAYSVPPGAMTPHGLKLMASMGRYFGAQYMKGGEHGLAGNVTCAGNVLALADPRSQRCQDSAAAFLRGLCGAGGGGAAAAAPKVVGAAPLFRDSSSTADGGVGARPGCHEASPRQLAAAVGGPSTAALTETLSAEVELVSNAVGCCRPSLCEKNYSSGGGGCGMLALPQSPNTGDDRVWRPFHGPVFAGSFFAEQLEMQMCEGLPMGLVSAPGSSRRLGTAAAQEAQPAPPLPRHHHHHHHLRVPSHARNKEKKAAAATTTMATDKQHAAPSRVKAEHSARADSALPGALSVEQVSSALRLQAVNMELGCNVWTAAALGSDLAAHVLAALLAGAGAEGGDDAASTSAAAVLEAASPAATNGGAVAAVPRATKLLLYFGHDTNLQFLRQLLRLHWLSEGWPRDLVEPGALLVFELWAGEVGGTATHWVTLWKVAATPVQQRHGATLSAARPPSRTQLAVPGCEGGFGARRGFGGLRCPLARFAALLRAALRAECVAQGPLRNFAAAAAPSAAGGALAERGARGGKGAAPPQEGKGGGAAASKAAVDKPAAQPTADKVVRRNRLHAFFGALFSVLFGLGAVAGVGILCNIAYQARRGEGSIAESVSLPPVTEAMASGFRTMKIGSAVQMVDMGSD